jgi:DNA-binding response OmpR family regulator
MPSAGERGAHPVAAPRYNRRFLWIEDDATYVQAIEHVARRMGVAVIGVRDVEEAEDWLRHGPSFDLIVCDYHLEGGTSAEFVRELLPCARPVAIVTADPASVDPSLDVPVLTKPIRLRELIADLLDRLTPRRAV